jgi:hypothetical protein
MDRHRLAENMDGRQPRRLVQRYKHGIDRLHGGVISAIHVVVFHKGICHHAQPAHLVIEDDERIGDHEDRFRQLQVVKRGLADSGLEEAHHVIAQVAHRAAGKARHVGRGHRDVLRHELLQLRQRIALRLELARLAAVDDRDLAPPALEDDARIASHKGVAPAVVDVLSALQQEGVAAVIDL